MAHELQYYQLNKNIFLETNLKSTDYDGVILFLYPEKSNNAPESLKKYINELSKIDKHIYKTPSVCKCELVCGGRLVLAPTGDITPYHDARVLKEAARKGVSRAVGAGLERPLVIVNSTKEFPDGELVSILGVFEALYVPLQIRERGSKTEFTKIGFYADGNTNDFEKIVKNAIALERSRILARDIAGSDPERMTPSNIVEYVKASFSNDAGITINVIEDEETLAKEYPLLSAVNRAASRIDRHKARICQIEYNPLELSKITDTLLLVGKGVTYDTGGADIKVSGRMIGMSRDKSGAAAVAGFLKACSIFKPQHLKVIGVLCLCRNSIGADSYVADELLVSRSGKTVRVVNTDAEGRLAMADALFKMSEIAVKEINAHIYTIATLTGHAKMSFGCHTAAIDNHRAREVNHSWKLQQSGSKLAEGTEISSVRNEDLEINVGKMKGDDLAQVNLDAKGRNHQLAAGFLIKVGGLEDTNIKYTHLDIAGSAGIHPDAPTAVPVLSLCNLHKVF